MTTQEKYFHLQLQWLLQCNAVAGVGDFLQNLYSAPNTHFLNEKVMTN